jgi:hypothetical protein
MSQLNDVYDMTFDNDYEFQEHVQTILTSLLDAHTRYKKPVCYNSNFVLPVTVSYSMPVAAGTAETTTRTTTSAVPVVEPIATLSLSSTATEYAKLYPAVDYTSSLGKEIKLLNGVEVTTAIASWGDNHETRSNNPGARFNAALRSYFYRSSTSTNIMPFDDVTQLDIAFTDGTSISLPWMVMYANGFGDTNECLASPETLESSVHESAASSKVDVALSHTRDAQFPTELLHAHTLKDANPNRNIIIPSDDPTTLSCFTQSVSSSDATSTGTDNVLVMKIASFSPPGDYQDAWSSFLGNAEKCLDTEYDMIVVDVMSNGGGYVCLGWRMLELLIEDFNIDHTKVQMKYDLPHSTLMDAFIETNNLPNPYINPQDVEEILNPATQKPYNNGEEWYNPGRTIVQGGVSSLRSEVFTLNCQEAEAIPSIDYKPKKFMSPDKLVILTDGTCGSTCASFTKIAQEAEKATFVGTGGLWDQVLDVSSFAGGFVCNPGYLQNIASMSGLTFPKFLTNQTWQFDWAVWYSAKFPSRPVQFTEQEPNYRTPFWAFPHVSVDAVTSTQAVSDLYDSVIDENIARLAAALPNECPTDPGWMKLVLFWVAVGLLVFCVVGAGVFAFKNFSASIEEKLQSESESKKQLTDALLEA